MCPSARKHTVTGSHFAVGVCVLCASAQNKTHNQTGNPQAAPAYAKLRVERMNKRMAGIRQKRAKEAEAAEKDA